MLKLILRWLGSTNCDPSVIRQGESKPASLMEQDHANCKLSSGTFSTSGSLEMLPSKTSSRLLLAVLCVPPTILATRGLEFTSTDHVAFEVFEGSVSMYA